MKHYTARGPWWSWIPVDLLAVATYGAVAAVAMPGSTTPVRVVLALPLVLFAPGYVLLATLYPRRRSLDRDGAAGRYDGRLGGRPSLTWGERLALSLAASLAIVPLLALAVAAVTDAIDVADVVGSLAAVVLVGSLAAGVRRVRVPEAERLRVPWRRMTAVRQADRVDTALAAAVVVGALLATSAMAYGVAAPDRGARYTDFALLATNETGDLVAGGYPTSFESGDRAELTASVGNHEGDPVAYTIVVEVQRVRVDGDDVTVVEQRELLRRTRTVQPGDRWRAEHTVEPSMTGQDLRLAYYLYRGDAPADAGPSSAYRRLHLWIDVEEPDATAAVGPSDDVDGQ